MAEFPPLRPFQKRVFDCIREGKSVILQAPTGSGKTRAALAPFIYNLARQESKLPHTCRYAVPLRVLANQFFRDYQSLAANIDREMPTRLVEKYRHIGRDAISIQTGEQADDPQMEAALTFCTIDQLLASFLAVPYGVDRIRANLNVAAIAGSYLALDEFHLYPLLGGKSFYGARTTTIEMLRLLKATTPFVLMTATFSTSLLMSLKDLLHAVVEVVDNQQELEDIAEGRSRTFELSMQPMNSDFILEQHQDCSLVICNTVLRAQELYLQLKERAGNHGPKVVLLHSRFEAERRKALSNFIERELGPGSWQGNYYSGQNLIVVATQVVEVGLDISVRTLHSEIAPANSLIQRAGRCARFKHQQGRVIVYPLPTDVEGKPVNTLPYRTEICTATWQALEDFHERIVGFKEEQKLIDSVHTDEDNDLLDRFERNRQDITRSIFQSLQTNDRSITSKLIRDVLQVPILIHDEPESAITSEPWRWQSFAMHPGSLASRWQILQEQKAQLGLDWACKRAIAVKEGDADDVDNQQKILYRWEVVTNPDQLATALMIVLPRQLASYYDDLGFVLLDGKLTVPLEPSPYQSARRDENKSRRGGDGSHLQSYNEHIDGLVKAYNWNIRNDIGYVARILEEQMNLTGGMIDQAIRLAIACHDLGKLDRTWQRWAQEWQSMLHEAFKERHKAPEEYAFLAKTDFDYLSSEQRELQKAVKTKRPHHACESVLLGRQLIIASLGVSAEHKERAPVLKAICAAIARHHTPQASTFSSTQLDPAAKVVIEEALRLARQDQRWDYDVSQISLTIPEGGDLAPEEKPARILTRPDPGPLSELETWLYFVIVRALRLADQRAGILD